MEASAPRPAEGDPARADLGRRLAVVVAIGMAVRLVLALTTDGHPYDMHSLRVVRDSLADHGLDVYRYVNLGNFHWPYAPAFFPWIALAGGLDGGNEQVFAAIVRLPSIAADAGLAWIVQHYLGLRGAGARTRLAAAAAIALGPVFIGVSGYHGQIDSLAILPAAAALVVWERMDAPHRALVAGGLIGVGAAIKTVPILVLLALIPSVRSWRELVTLSLSAAAVPIVIALPFLAATPDYVVAALRDYHGYPGQGGLSLAVQPNLMESWLMGSNAHPPRFSGLTRRLFDHASLLNAAIFAALLAFLARFRPQPALGASLAWLAVLTLAPAFFMQYLIWGLPFFLMAGYLRAAVCLQLAVSVPLLLSYLGPWKSSAPVYVYVAIMLAVWIAMLTALAAVARGIVRRRPPADLIRPPAIAYAAPSHG